MSCRLLVIRHAEARNVGPDGPQRDEERPLTERGRRQCHRLGRALERLRLVPPRLLVSPLCRARETAEELVDVVADEVKLEISPLLVPPVDLDGLRRYLQRQAESHTGTLAIVGHQPCLGNFLQALISGPGAPGLPLGKGGVACVRLRCWEWGEGELQWLLSGRVTKALNKVAAVDDRSLPNL